MFTYLTIKAVKVPCSYERLKFMTPNYSETQKNLQEQVYKGNYRDELTV